MASPAPSEDRSWKGSGGVALRGSDYGTLCQVHSPIDGIEEEHGGGGELSSRATLPKPLRSGRTDPGSEAHIQGRRPEPAGKDALLPGAGHGGGEVPLQAS